MSEKSKWSGRTQPERLANLFFLLIFLGLVVGTGIYYYHPTPPTDYADGVYTSPGRPEVIIHQGTVEMGNERAKMKLGYVKNVLIGSLDSPLGPLFHTEAGLRAPVDLVFDDNRQFTTTDHDWNEIVYKKAQAARHN